MNAVFLSTVGCSDCSHFALYWNVALASMKLAFCSGKAHTVCEAVYGSGTGGACTQQPHPSGEQDLSFAKGTVWQSAQSSQVVTQDTWLAAACCSEHTSRLQLRTRPQGALQYHQYNPCASCWAVRCNATHPIGCFCRPCSSRPPATHPGQLHASKQGLVSLRGQGRAQQLASGPHVAILQGRRTAQVNMRCMYYALQLTA